MEKLKGVIIGCGRISYRHVQALIDNDKEAVLVGLCDVIEDRAIEKQSQYLETFPNREVSVFTDYKEMLKELKPDFAAICTESGYHGEIALFCLSQGVNVLIEKPMAMSLEEIDKINELAENKNLKVGVCHQNRFNPPIQKLRRAIDEGKFGKLVNGTARILWTRDQHYYELAPWRGTKKLDGGTLMNQCIHNIDLLIWMMGSDVVSVQSERGTFLRDIEMEDFGAILLRFKSGSIGIIEGSACVYPKNLEETLSIFGETGTAVIGGLAVNEIKTWNFEDENETIEEEDSSQVQNVYGVGHTPLLKDFIDAIKDDRLPLINGYEARKPVEVILKSYEQRKLP